MSSSSGSGDTNWVQRLEQIRDGDSIGTTLQKILVLPIVAFGVQTANLGEALFDFVIIPLGTFTTNLAGFINTLIGGPGQIIDAGVIGSANQVRLFGIAAFPVAVAIVLAGALVFAYYTDLEVTSDTLPFSVTDLPLIGNDEGEE